jgi:pimeloyl-ACP methyl ester carboxylesterase
VGALTLKGLAAPLPAAVVVRTPIAAPRPRRERQRRRWPLGLVVVAVAAVAVVGVMLSRTSSGTSPVLRTVAYVPRLTPSPCPTYVARDVLGATCENLAVPEDRSRPGGRWLHLPVTRAPARTSAPAPDPTISIGNDASSEDLATSPARDHSEELSITPRSFILYDNPAMACPEFGAAASLALTKPNRDPAVIAEGQPALRACHDRLARAGVALGRYTVEDNAEDVIDLVRALGVARVDVVAADQPAAIALGVVRDAPRLVRTLTLLNPWLPTPASIDPTAILAAAYDQYVSLCNASPSCARAYPRLAAQSRVAWAASNAHPQVVDATFTDGTGTVVHRRVLINGDTAAKEIAATLGDPRADTLIAAASAHPPPLALIATYALTGRGAQLADSAFAWATVLSYACAYPSAPSLGRPVSDASRPELAGVDDGVLDWACAAWEVPEARDVTAESASTVPALFVFAPLDATVPQQPNLTAGFPNGNALFLPTLGYEALDFGSPPCLNALRRALLAAPASHLDTAACGAQSPPINFVTATP